MSWSCSRSTRASTRWSGRGAYRRTTGPWRPQPSAWRRGGRGEGGHLKTGGLAGDRPYFAADLGIPVTPVEDPTPAIRQSALCVTCTPARAAFDGRDAVAPGTFIAAVGAAAVYERALRAGHGSVVEFPR